MKTKEILILGLGKEGSDSFKFLKKVFPNKVLGVGDRLDFENLNAKIQKLLKSERKNKRHLGKDYLKALKNYDIIIKSPGVPPKIIKPFLTKKQQVISQTEIFFDNCPGKIVGITATKGKSTTASLIYNVLKQGGVKAHLVGNIGRPVLNLLLSATPKDVYVYELSSHQLFDLKKSPQIAVFLNVFPEHLDYYRSFQEYAKAKANITKYQNKNDFLVYNQEDELVTEIAKKSKAKKIPIKDQYYQLNRNAARALGKIFKIPKTTIAAAINNFKGLAHRLEPVGTFKGITFYNDSLSTIPETTIAALDFLGDKVQTIFLGGFDRGLDFKNLAKRILKSKIKTVILFPTTGKRIWKEILQQTQGKSSKLPNHFFADNMPEAVRIAYRETERDKISLLSTASPSFSIFIDYKEKGNLFKRYVKKYGKTK